MNAMKEELAKQTNQRRVSGMLEEVISGADVFIGVSVAGALTPAMVRSMNRGAIVFALANPVPEIMPDEAKAAGAAVVATGRSDLPNQVNNVLAFPGIFRGALDVRATQINEAMKIAAAEAIAGLIQPEELTEEYVIPNPFDQRVVAAVASAVARAAIETGVARNKEKYEGKTLLERGNHQ
jgi:malate dehydrogenase (oxaloacetate-decarboxylating)